MISVFNFLFLSCDLQSELFQEDLFPDTQGDEPSLTSEQWVSGTNADPVLISLREKFEGKSVTSTKKKTGLASKMPAKKAGASAEDVSNWQALFLALAKVTVYFITIL